MARTTNIAGYDGSRPLEDGKQELFCCIFTTNTLPHYWSNAQNSYEFAFGYVDKIEKIEEKIFGLKKLRVEPNKKKRGGRSLAALEREIQNEYDAIAKIHNTSRACASRLLTGANIKLRNGYLLNMLAKDVIVDQELSFLVQQRENLHIKMNAIEHYNKKEMRIRERLDIKHHFDPVKTIRMNPAKKPA